MNTIKVGVNSAGIQTPMQYGAVEHYRNLGCYNHLRKELKKPIELLDPKKGFSVHDLNSMDLLHLQNPYTKQHVELIQRAKMHGIKILVDFDDDLIHIPDNNHNRRSFEGVKPFIAQCCQLADLVTTSTNALAETLKEFAEPHVINNAYYPALQPLARDAYQPLVMWRGSASHADDCIEFQNEVVKLMEDSKDVPFFFWTNKTMAEWTMDFPMRVPNAQGQKVGKWEIVQPVAVLDYFRMLSMQVRPMLTLVPLKDYQFNRAKSNIAFIEATLAGGVALVPDWEEWKHEGAIVYKSKAQFYEKAMKVLQGKVNVEAYRSKALKVVNEKYNLDVVNYQRWDLIDKIF